MAQGTAAADFVEPWSKRRMDEEDAKLGDELCSRDVFDSAGLGGAQCCQARYCTTTLCNV